MTTKTKQPLGPNQQAWVDALRSGDFKQAQGQLQTATGFCCLGVACAINSNKANYTIDSFISGGDLTEQPDTMELLKLRTPNGAFNDLAAIEHAPRSLIQLNDGVGWDFNQIADFIEEYAHELFHEPA